MRNFHKLQVADTLSKVASAVPWSQRAGVAADMLMSHPDYDSQEYLHAGMLDRLGASFKSLTNPLAMLATGKLGSPVGMPVKYMLPGMHDNLVKQVQGAQPGKQMLGPGGLMPDSLQKYQHQSHVGDPRPDMFHEAGGPLKYHGADSLFSPRQHIGIDVPIPGTSKHLTMM